MVPTDKLLLLDLTAGSDDSALRQAFLDDLVCLCLSNHFCTGSDSSGVHPELKAFASLIRLQDPADKRVIIADAKLARLMGQERFNGFGMTKVLQPHFGAPLPDPPVEATAAVGL